MRTPLAKNILRLLARNEWTMKELAVRSGVNVHTVSSYISSPHEPTLGKLRKIRAAFGCTWDELLEER